MEIKIEIEIKDGLAGYVFKDDHGNVVRFEDMSRKEQVRAVNSFVNGYELFVHAVKEEGL